MNTKKDLLLEKWVELLTWFDGQKPIDSAVKPSLNRAKELGILVMALNELEMMILAWMTGGAENIPCQEVCERIEKIRTEYMEVK